MGAQREENKGVELTGGRGNAGRRWEGASGGEFKRGRLRLHAAVRLVVENPHQRRVASQSPRRMLAAGMQT